MDEIKAKRLSPLGYFKLFFVNELKDLINCCRNKQIYFLEKSKAYGYQEQHKLLSQNIDIKWVHFDAQVQTNVGKCIRYSYELVANPMRQDKFETILNLIIFNLMLNFTALTNQCASIMGITIASNSLGANQYALVSRFGVVLLL